MAENRQEIPPPPDSAPKLSIVVPAYNEERRLPGALDAILAYTRGHDLPTELIIIDDGSHDGTADVVRSRAAGDANLKLLHNDTNRGKGHSVRRGMLAARGELCLMCDADLSAPIEELGKLLPWVERGYDIVIGSRDLPESVLDPPQPWSRRWPAWVFRAWRRRMLLPGIRDTQCGFKLFRQAAAQELFGRQREDGWLFDCEVLGLAERLGYRIKEVGIRWCASGESRVHVPSEIFATPANLRRIVSRLQHFK
ncbi:MAG: glycosyltransferase family 2 protein [Phycisphaerae bacterium]|nr:glycosyltransferase family 2 protein [Phycisphaerae bacterium]